MQKQTYFNSWSSLRRQSKKKDPRDENEIERDWRVEKIWEGNAKTFKCQVFRSFKQTQSQSRERNILSVEGNSEKNAKTERFAELKELLNAI